MQVGALLLLGRSPYTDGASVTGPRLKKTLSARGVRVVFTYGKPSLQYGKTLLVYVRARWTCLTIIHRPDVSVRL